MRDVTRPLFQPFPQRLRRRRPRRSPSAVAHPGRFTGLRRSFKLAAALALMLLVTSAAHASTVPGDIRFQVLRQGEDMGTHTFSFSPEADGGVRAQITIDLLVRVALIPAYRYTHRNTEVWRNGQLVSLTSTTNDDGDDYRVQVRREGDALRVNSLTRGQLTHEGVTHSTTYWDYGFVRQTRVLNSQSGEVLSLQWTQVGVESVPVAGGTVQAEHWRSTGDLPLDLWYAVDTKELVGLEFTAKGETISYRRTNALGS